GCGDTQPGNVHAEELGGDIADHEVALGAYPQLTAAVRADARQARMRLDIALMRRFSLEGTLNDDVGLLESRFHIPMAEFRAPPHIRGSCGLGLDAFRQNRVVD